MDETALAHAFLREGRAQVVRALVQAIVGAGAEGYPVAGLKASYEQLGVPLWMRDSIERQLREDWNVSFANGRAVWTMTPSEFRATLDRQKRPIEIGRSDS